MPYYKQISLAMKYAQGNQGVFQYKDSHAKL